MRYIYISDSGDAALNLARDEYLLSASKPGDIVLHLYVNTKAVIIGRNQNPYIECNLLRMQEDGVQLVRRVSGGGAVYHDTGNLNFSFITDCDTYDEKRQNSVIVSALSEFGVKCEISGRNDITVNGSKFSGNAFCGRGGMRQHHGTLLISSELGVFDRYLIPPKQKLEAKGVKSVRARICNLSEQNDEINTEAMTDALCRAFCSEYGNAELTALPENADVAALYRKHTSFEWLMGETPHFDYRLERKFPWGMVHLCFSADGGRLSEVKLYTDSLNQDLSASTENLLKDAAFSKVIICKRLYSGDAEQKDMADWIAAEFINGF